MGIFEKRFDAELQEWIKDEGGSRTNGQYRGVSNCKWVYGNLLKDDQFSYIVEEFGEHTNYTLNCDIWKEVIPETVGQWSGFIDTSKKRMYVGDK